MNARPVAPIQERERSSWLALLVRGRGSSFVEDIIAIGSITVVV